jgi:hypothetical protein
VAEPSLFWGAGAVGIAASEGFAAGESGVGAEAGTGGFFSTGGAGGVGFSTGGGGVLIWKAKSLLASRRPSSEKTKAEAVLKVTGVFWW